MAKFSTIEEYVASLAEPLRAAAEQARLVIEAELPGAGAIWHGQPVWSLGPPPERLRSACSRATRHMSPSESGGAGRSLTRPVGWLPAAGWRTSS